METISLRDMRFMRLALREAQNSQHRRRHGCVLVKGGSVLASECNKEKNDPTTVDFRHATIHAEEAVLRRVGDRASGATVYAARMMRNGEPGISRPCPRCLAALGAVGVVRVIWSDENEFFSARIRELIP